MFYSSHVYGAAGYPENILAGYAVFGAAVYIQCAAAKYSKVVFGEKRCIRRAVVLTDVGISVAEGAFAALRKNDYRLFALCRIDRRSILAVYLHIVKHKPYGIAAVCINCNIAVI